MLGPLASCLFALALPRAQGPDRVPDTAVTVAPVIEREVATRRSFVGTVRARRRVLVGSTTAGRVVQFLAEQGQRIEAGGVLARLRTRPIEIRLAGARAELKLRSEELRELENGARTEELAQARSRVDAAKAEESYRKWALLKAQKLFEKGSFSEEQLRQARFEAERTSARRAELEAALELLQKGPRTERIAQARARVAIQQEVVNQITDELDRHVVKAPFSGWVAREMTEAGAWLRQGDPVVELVALDTVEIEVPVPEGSVRSLAPGQKALVTIESLAGEEFEGEVCAVVSEGDERARTFPVRVRLENRLVGKLPLLKAGMFAQVKLSVGAPKKVLLVPKDALVLGGRRPLVFVADPLAERPGFFSVRPVVVRTGRTLHDLIAVEGKLARGARVVVRGNERLRPGQIVRVTGARPGRQARKGG